MKKFENPMIEVEKIEIADVITTSGCDGFECPNDTGCPLD